MSFLTQDVFWIELMSCNVAVATVSIAEPDGDGVLKTAAVSWSVTVVLRTNDNSFVLSRVILSVQESFVAWSSVFRSTSDFLVSLAVISNVTLSPNDSFVFSAVLLAEPSSAARSPVWLPLTDSTVVSGV